MPNGFGERMMVGPHFSAGRAMLAPGGFLDFAGPPLPLKTWLTSPHCSIVT